MKVAKNGSHYFLVIILFCGTGCALHKPCQNDLHIGKYEIRYYDASYDVTTRGAFSLPTHTHFDLGYRYQVSKKFLFGYYRTCRRLTTRSYKSPADTNYQYIKVFRGDGSASEEQMGKCKIVFDKYNKKVIKVHGTEDPSYSG